jgi:hypothetical protein
MVQIRVPSVRVNAQSVQIARPHRPHTKAARKSGWSAHMPGPLAGAFSVDSK